MCVQSSVLAKKRKSYQTWREGKDHVIICVNSTQYRSDHRPLILIYHYWAFCLTKLSHRRDHTATDSKGGNQSGSVVWLFGFRALAIYLFFGSNRDLSFAHIWLYTPCGYHELLQTTTIMVYITVQVTCNNMLTIISVNYNNNNHIVFFYYRK